MSKSECEYEIGKYDKEVMNEVLDATRDIYPTYMNTDDIVGHLDQIFWLYNQLINRHKNHVPCAVDFSYWILGLKAKFWTRNQTDMEIVEVSKRLIGVARSRGELN